jgi:hypothetical protein
VLGLLAIGAVVAVVATSGRKDDEQPSAKDPEKPGDAVPPAGFPDLTGATTEPAKKDAASSPKKEPSPPTRKEPPEPQKKDAAQQPAPTVSLQLSPTLPTFRLRQASAKPELVQKPAGSPLLVETPFDKLRRVFPPRDRAHDTFVVWESNPATGGQGQRLTADVYGPVGGTRVARFEYDGDGGALKCDISTDATRFVAAGPGGRLTVWDVSKKAKTLDGFDPYADKPEDRKAGLAAVFFAKSPEHLVTVSTAGVVHLHEIATQKTVATFTPSGPRVPGRVEVGKGVALEDNRSSLVLAVGGTVYQVATAPPLEVVWKHDLGGEVRSLGVGVAGNPGRVTYVFEASTSKGGKERAVLFCLPRATPEVYRWPDAAGEPSAVAWAGTDLCVLTTAKGAVWAEYDTEAKRFLVLALAEVSGGKALHATTERAHWFAVPDPADAKGSRFVELAMPPDGLIDYRDAADARQPVHVVRLDAKGLWR